MSDDTYTPPPGSERAAEMVHRGRVEMDRARDRLNDAPIEQSSACSTTLGSRWRPATMPSVSCRSVSAPPQ